MSIFQLKVMTYNTKYSTRYSITLETRKHLAAVTLSPFLFACSAALVYCRFFAPRTLYTSLSVVFTKEKLIFDHTLTHELHINTLRYHKTKS